MVGFVAGLMGKQESMHIDLSEPVLIFVYIHSITSCFPNSEAKNSFICTFDGHYGLTFVH